MLHGTLALSAAADHRPAHSAVLPFGGVLLRSVRGSDSFLNSARYLILQSFKHRALFCMLVDPTKCCALEQLKHSDGKRNNAVVRPVQ